MLTRMLLACCSILAVVGTADARPRKSRAPHNIILFVADGLRSKIVTPQTAPALAELRRKGVDFHNSHSLYPTFTTANASAIATGHLFGDTGDFANSIYVAAPIPSAHNSPTPFLENDAVLGDVNARFGGNYLNEISVLTAANSAGYSTASVGKLGPAAIQAVTARNGTDPIVVDDSSGRPGGIMLSPRIAAAIGAARLAAQAPTRGDNGKSGNATTPGTLTANVDQQRWFLDVTTKVLLPRFKAAKKPFVLVYWSRDPDGTQHNQGDSLGSLTPGINGPTSMAAIRNADANLAELRQALRRLRLDKTTDIIVTADHGFSTISRESVTSPAARASYPDTPKGLLPSGFLAIDLARALAEPLTDADRGFPIDATKGQHPIAGNGLVGPDPAHPHVVVAANGGSDLIYLPQADAKALAPRVVDALIAQDYVSSIFVDDDLGPIPGTLPTSAIGLRGTALTPRPSIVVGFRSYATGCPEPELCSVQVSDTMLQQGQGMHGSFSRADTHNFMAAVGPDFKVGFIDPSPTSNADIGITIAHLLHLTIAPKGKLIGRVLSEGLRGGASVASTHGIIVAPAAASGFATTLLSQSAAGETYFDTAGQPGRTVGLDLPPK